MYLDFLLQRFRQATESEAMIWQERTLTYGALLELTRRDLAFLKSELPPAAVVGLEADFSPRSSALLLSLIELGCIIVPLTASVAHKKEEFLATAQVEYLLSVDAQDEITLSATGVKASHELLLKLKAAGHPGLVLFSSGSTGKSKAALHDFLPLLDKFKVPRQNLRMLTFLLFDHIGGINTLLYVLSNSGCIVTLRSRQPAEVCTLIERHRVQVLPTSPSFLNLLLLSEAYREHDLSSLQLITYGTENMPESTLRRLRAILPQVRLQQTYGLSEIGIMRSKSESSDSLWVKLGGEDFQIRVVDGLLEVKAKSAMLGYLNASSPFTSDGWFQTGDEVEVKGDYLRILGRRSELINVGGQKVYPAEVESAIQEMDGVEEVAVSAEHSALLGNIVKARIRLKDAESAADFKQRMRLYLKGKLESFKVPQKVVIVEQTLTGERFKKMRRE